MEKETNMAITVTEMEQALMTWVAINEMNTNNGAVPEHWSEAYAYLWADEMASAIGTSEKGVGGLMTSLKEKGLITFRTATKAEEREGEYGEISLTEKGFVVWSTNYKADQDAPAEEPKEEVAEGQLVEQVAPGREGTKTAARRASANEFIAQFRQDTGRFPTLAEVEAASALRKSDISWMVKRGEITFR